MCTGKKGNRLAVGVVLGLLLLCPAGGPVAQAQPAWDSFQSLVEANNWHNEAVLYACFGYTCEPATYFAYAAEDAYDAFYNSTLYYSENNTVSGYYLFVYSFYVYYFMNNAYLSSSDACSLSDYSYLYEAIVYGYLAIWYNQYALYYAALNSGAGFY